MFSKTYEHYPLVLIQSTFESAFSPGTGAVKNKEWWAHNHSLLMVSTRGFNVRGRRHLSDVKMTYGEKGVKELKRIGKEWKNAGRRNSVQNSLNAVNSLKHVETRRLRRDSIPSQLIRVLEKSTGRQWDT